MTDCGHWCCAIRANAYHGHLTTPGSCERCVALIEATSEAVPLDTWDDLQYIVDSVSAHMVPAVAGLPDGEELTELIQAKARQVYLDGLVDPDLSGLDAGSRRRVLVARVGLGLAFPHGC